MSNITSIPLTAAEGALSSFVPIGVAAFMLDFICLGVLCLLDIVFPEYSNKLVRQNNTGLMKVPIGNLAFLIPFLIDLRNLPRAIAITLAQAFFCLGAPGLAAYIKLLLEPQFTGEIPKFHRVFLNGISIISTVLCIVFTVVCFVTNDSFYAGLSWIIIISTYMAFSSFLSIATWQLVRYQNSFSKVKSVNKEKSAKQKANTRALVREVILTVFGFGLLTPAYIIAGFHSYLTQPAPYIGPQPFDDSLAITLLIGQVLAALCIPTHFLVPWRAFRAWRNKRNRSKPVKRTKGDRRSKLSVRGPRAQGSRVQASRVKGSRASQETMRGNRVHPTSTAAVVDDGKNASDAV